jgi:hypothetical protein
MSAPAPPRCSRAPLRAGPSSTSASRSCAPLARAKGRPRASAAAFLATQTHTRLATMC